MARTQTASAAPRLAREPPHSVDFEQALLASCLLEGGQESLLLCLESHISPDSFYLPAHQTIFRAIHQLYTEAKPVTELLLAEKLSSQGELASIGGYDTLQSILSRIDTPAHVHHYIQRIRDLELVRRVLRVATAGIEKAYAGIDDVAPFLEGFESSVFAISQDRLVDTVTPIQKSVDRVAPLINQMLERKGAVAGVPSGFVDLDRLTFGFHPSEMIVLAARPSIGKTSLALGFAQAAVLPNQKGQKGFPTLFFSLEMSADQLALRLLCSQSGIDMTALKKGRVSGESLAAIHQAINFFRNTPLWIDESASMTILEMRAKARRLTNKHRLGLILIDYLQLIAGSDTRAPREQQVAEISRGIKAMAKELNVPVVVLSQLNRDTEREKRLPRLSDLRESGAIEQDADVVLLLAKRKGDDETEETSSDTAIRELIIAKQRNGPVGIVRLAFRKNLTKFENFSAANAALS
jgi:replicative DNA helicase